jgi:hypothetical protein
VAGYLVGKASEWTPLDDDQVAATMKRVKARQKAVGYPGDFKTWVAQNTPPDLE